MTYLDKKIQTLLKISASMNSTKHMMLELVIRQVMSLKRHPLVAATQRPV